MRHFDTVLLCVIAGLLAGCQTVNTETEGADAAARVGPTYLDVDHGVYAHLGEEHIRNTHHRTGADGARLIAWGRRILEWSLYNPADSQVVVPEKEGTWYTNGAAILDVDGDGVDEVITGRHKYPNGATTEFILFNEVPGQATWARSTIGTYEHGNWAAPHDLQSFVVEASGEDITGVVATIGRGHLIWYEKPDDPKNPWIEHDIGTLPAERQSGMKIADINDDGRPDIVTGMFWVEMPADPRADEWPMHRFGQLDENDWGGMAKHGVADLNGDGASEIVVTEAEIPGARLVVYERPEAGPDALWEPIVVDEGLYAPHSLVVADFNEDGRKDIITGEMTMGGWDFELNPHPTIRGYANRGGLQFGERVIDDGWGVHEMGLAPERHNGKLLLYAADEIQEQKRSGMNTHVSYWTIDAVKPGERLAGGE